ncbi:methyltransferase [Spongiibacter marinus]|uniref:methyltransferase n=1 Tax=Spongiibacter marinus TaxID=354246 RepID=UPI0019601EF1|nr:methyltransferase [Spongiibacter marinus]MBM7421759.1 hypothetical protein [Spongiibacter marinus]
MTSNVLTAAKGADLLQNIDQLLSQHEALWRAGSNAESVTHYDALFRALCTLSAEDVAQLQGDDLMLLERLSPHFAHAKDILAILSYFTPPIAPPHIEPPSGIGGRKWQQIQAFCGGLASLSGNVIEWCSGKGYLGQALRFHPQHSPSSVIGLEIDSDLVTSGNRRHANTNQRIVRCDVLSEQAESFVADANAIIALHACGGLHQRMLKVAAAASTAQIALAPCCYHRFIEQYAPLSKAVNNSPLSITTQDLRLAVRQTVTARRGETQARRQLHHWWLASQQLAQQQGIALDQYRALPHSAAKKGFSYFVEQQCAANGIATLDMSDADTALANAAGQQLMQEQRGLAAMLFRRLLELRCVLDSALFLCEQDYHVTLSVFCPSTTTPRNFLLSARRKNES